MNRTKQVRFGIAVIAGVAVGIATGVWLSWEFAPLAGWDVMALVLLGLLWLDFHGSTPSQTACTARRDDMGRTILDSVVLLASLASIAAVVVLLTTKQDNVQPLVHIGFGLASIIISWATVHAVYTLRYAVMYYGDPEGGIDFNDRAKPTFVDFAYVAYTIGMTYQVSDTSFVTRDFRRVALRHALLSFVFGTAIIATTINFIASLSQ